MTRRDSLRIAGLALGGLALGGRSRAEDACETDKPKCYPTDFDTQKYSYLDTLENLYYDDDKSKPAPDLLENEMRITFMGSCIPPVRRAQAMMSVFVEVGWKDGKPVDQVIFDIGSGSTRNYGARNVGFGRMDKIFLNHLHGDHMSDIVHTYCFGPSLDRKSPLYVWGPGPSGVRAPEPDNSLYDDGTKAFCEHLREMCRWHTESFSFQNTAYKGFKRPTKESWGTPVDPVPVGMDFADDGYGLVPIELDWRTIGGVAYDNPTTGVKVTHFPVIHCRRGSLGYKLEWNGLSMIYTSDTKPEWNTINQAINGGKGIDVLIHEMVVPPEIWAMEALHLPEPGKGDQWDNAVQDMVEVQDSSHTPHSAFGYLLKQIDPRPRLTVATHYPVSDDTIDCALRSISKHCPDITENGPQLTWSFDLMSIRVFAGNPKPEILQQKCIVKEFGFSPVYAGPPDERLKVPKYHTAAGDPDPYAQISLKDAILAGPDTYCKNGY